MTAESKRMYLILSIACFVIAMTLMWIAIVWMLKVVIHTDVVTLGSFAAWMLGGIVVFMPRKLWRSLGIMKLKIVKIIKLKRLRRRLLKRRAQIINLVIESSPENMPDGVVPNLIVAMTAYQNAIDVIDTLLDKHIKHIKEI